MGRQFQYTTLDRIISKLYRDLGLEEVSETDIIEWSGEALEAIGAITMYEEAVCFVEVKNHMADLPNGLHSIIQVARNMHWTNEKKETLCPANIILDDEVTELEEPKDCGCCTSTCVHTNPQGFEDYPVPLDCNGMPITDYEVAYYRPYFDLQYEYYGWMRSNYYTQKYVPIRLANHSFFNSLVCAEEEGLYNSCTDEYTIIDNKIRLSFKEGSIAVAYYRQKVDPETGYPMIPDDISVTQAITFYITWKYMARMWYMGREGYADKMQVAEDRWHWYCKQAGNKMIIPHGIDEHQNILDERNHLIPRHNRYYGFFGKLGRPEYQGFKDPNRRNFRLRGI